MLRYTKRDTYKKGLNWFDIIAHGHKQREHETVKKLYRRGHARPSEKALIRKDASTVPVIVGYAVPDTRTNQMIVLVLDITERKRLEERKDEFLGIASHELKTPLTSIKGYTQILERIIYQMGDERLNQYLKKTNNYIERLNSLISELLDVSKIQAGKLKLEYSAFSFDELVRESINTMKYTNSSHNIVANGNVQDTIYADKHRLEQVFVNLISNAIKYSPKADRVIVHTKRYNGDVEVTVEDFGIGIAHEQIQNLFKRFYRVESSSQQFSGLGIGLYISSEIVRRHGGKMDVESEVGKGSRFRFSIPVTNAPKHSTIEA
jgi:signal transduction histidine kinase